MLIQKTPLDIHQDSEALNAGRGAIGAGTIGVIGALNLGQGLLGQSGHEAKFSGQMVVGLMGIACGFEASRTVSGAHRQGALLEQHGLLSPEDRLPWRRG